MRGAVMVCGNGHIFYVVETGISRIEEIYVEMDIIIRRGCSCGSECHTVIMVETDNHAMLDQPPDFGILTTEHGIQFVEDGSFIDRPVVDLETIPEQCRQLQFA